MATLLGGMASRAGHPWLPSISRSRCQTALTPSRENRAGTVRHLLFAAIGHRARRKVCMDTLQHKFD
ncbi:MAG: hypothetical protein KDF57_14120, partial [Ottowia sp.]|nr:hypothetical protein [Ottowia sp.]